MAQEMTLDLFTTLQQAKDWLAHSVEDPEGAICPCCERFDKVYSRKINNSSIRALASLHRYSRTGDAYHHYSDFVAKFQHGDFPKLQWLGLLERAPQDDKNKKTSGMYRITGRGRAFVRGEVAIPERVVLYHNVLVGTDGDQKYIKDFWPDFNYAELMQA